MEYLRWEVMKEGWKGGTNQAPPKKNLKDTRTFNEYMRYRKKNSRVIPKTNGKH
jgi:hypothetical protein